MIEHSMIMISRGIVWSDKGMMENADFCGDATPSASISFATSWSIRIRRTSRRFDRSPRVPRAMSRKI